MANYSIGLDFGTLSVRGVLVNISSGEIEASSEYEYPHGVMDRLEGGRRMPLGTALAHPADYMEGLQQVVRSLIAQKPQGDIVAIGVDATSCSVVPLAQNGSPLCLTNRFSDHPHAYIKLWKHHCAVKQAERLYLVAKERGERFLSDCGGSVSAESFFPKVLETFEEDRDVFDSAALFLEVGEWITLILTGKLTASQSMACFKRFYHPFRGYPEAAYFETVAPQFAAVLDKLKGKMIPVGTAAGTLHRTAAEILGLPVGIAVAAPQIDAHTAPAAVGAKAGDMVCVMGTSGVSLMCSHSDSGMEGIYSSSAHCFLPDGYGHEGGQSALGDTFGWFVENALPPHYHDAAMEKERSLHEHLCRLAAKKKAGESGLLALNWWSGVRTPYADHTLSGSIVGLTLSTKPEDIYRALLEASIYDTRRIRDSFQNRGHKVYRLFLCGGVARQNEFFCRLFADIMGMDVQLCHTQDACALGSAIHAAFAWGEEKNEMILSSMRSKQIKPFYPDFDTKEVYDKLYAQYLRLSENMNDYDSVMRKIREIKGENI